MRIPFVDPQEVHYGERIPAAGPRQVALARALGQVPVLPSGWEGTVWLSELAHGDQVLLVTIDGDQSGVFFVPGRAMPPAELLEPLSPMLWAAIWRDGAVHEEPAHRPRAVLAAGDQGPHLSLVWEPGTLVDLNPQAGGICYMVAGADYRWFAARRRQS